MALVTTSFLLLLVTTSVALVPSYLGLQDFVPVAAVRLRPPRLCPAEEAPELAQAAELRRSAQQERQAAEAALGRRPEPKSDMD